MVEFRILGPFEVVDREPLSLGGHKQQAVLAVLLLQRGEVVAADRLIEAIWAGRAPATAGKTLQVYVSNLRKALGDGLLITQGRGYMLAVEPDQVDSDRFEKLAANGREALERGDLTKARAWLQAALALWRGPALADFSYENFAQSEIARLDEVRMAALEYRIEADLRLGEHATLVPELEALVHEHPLRERLYEHLMLALYRSGRQVDALERYQRARRKLIDEFGVEPGPRLQEIQRAVLTHDAALDEPDPSLGQAQSPADQQPAAPREKRRGRGIPALVGLLSGSRKWLLAGASAVLVLVVVLLATGGGGSHSGGGTPGARVDWAQIASPAPGGVYTRGQWAATNFTCGEKSGGPALASCNDSTGTDTVSGGHGHLDTSRAGAQRYTVAVAAKNGTTKTATITYTVVPALSVSIQEARATVLHGQTEIPLTCSGGGPAMACHGRLSLAIARGRGATFRLTPVGSASFSIPTSATASARFSLISAAQQMLGHSARHQLRVLATTTLSNGERSQRAITLSRHR